MWYFSHKAWGKSLGDFPLTFCSPSLRNLLAPSSHEKRKKSPPPLCIGLSDVGLNHYYQRRVLLVYVLKIFNQPCTSLPQVKEVWGASKNVTREGEGGKAFLSTFTLVERKGVPMPCGLTEQQFNAILCENYYNFFPTFFLVPWLY